MEYVYECRIIKNMEIKKRIKSTHDNILIERNLLCLMDFDRECMLDHSRCPLTIASTIELCTVSVSNRKQGFIFILLINKKNNATVENNWFYLRMTSYHTIFTDIYSMIKAKLIGHLTFRTFTQTHIKFSGFNIIKFIGNFDRILTKNINFLLSTLFHFFFFTKSAPRNVMTLTFEKGKLVFENRICVWKWGGYLYLL